MEPTNQPAPAAAPSTVVPPVKTPAPGPGTADPSKTGQPSASPGAPAPDKGGVPAPLPTDAKPGEGDAPSLSPEDMAKQFSAMTRKMNGMDQAYRELQSQLRKKDEELAAALKSGSADIEAAFPEGDDWLKTLGDGKGKFLPLINRFVDAKLAAMSKAIAEATAAGRNAIPAASFQDTLRHTDALKDVVRFAQESKMEQGEVVSLLVEYGMKVDPQTGNITQMPFHWCDTPEEIVKVGKTLIRGIVAPRMAKNTIAASVDAGRKAADALIKEQVPTGGGTATPSGSDPGGDGNVNGQDFINFLLAPASSYVG